RRLSGHRHSPAHRAARHSAAAGDADRLARAGGRGRLAGRAGAALAATAGGAAMKRQLLLPSKPQALRAFQRAAATYDDAAALQQEVGRRLLERLEVIRIEPERALDLRAGTGQASADLLKRYPRAQVLALDVAPAMLQQARR